MLKDPFRTYDYSLEKERGEDYRRVRTSAFKKILTLAQLKSNVILIAPKGAGKSTTMGEVGKEFGDNCLAMVGFRTTADIYNYLWLKIWQREKEKIESRFQFGDLADYRVWFKEKYCKYPLCPRKRVKAACMFQSKPEVGFDERTFEQICEELYHKKDPCPMKRKIVNELLDSKLEFFRNKVFLLDIHDDLLNFKKGFDLPTIEKLLEIFQRLGSVVVTATNDQYVKLKKSEAIARIKVVSFPLPTEDELVQIYEGRLSTANVNDVLFTDGAVRKIVELSHRLPRTFVQMCGTVFLEKILRDRKEPVDEVFVVEVLGDGGSLSETDAVELLVERLKRERKGWVKVKELVKALKSEFRVSVSEGSLGRRLKNEWLLPQRYNPNSEYKFEQ